MIASRSVNVLIVLFLLGVYAHAPAQSDERPQLKDFGSSLKRLKWDSQKNAAVEKPGKKISRAEEDEIVRVNTDLITCDVQVRDGKGNTVSGLTANDFVISEDAQPQTVQHFSLGSDRNVGRTIVLLIDYSGSQFPYLDNSVAAAKMLVDQLGPKDLMAIVTDDVAMLVDFTRDKEKLKQALESRKRSAHVKFGLSKQFSALMATVREAFSAEDLRPIVIFQTDGDELFSLRPSVPSPFGIPASSSFGPGQKESFSLLDVYHAIEKSRASVYTVIPSQGLIEAQNDRELKPVAEVFRKLKPDYVEWAALRRWEQLAAAGAAIGGWTAYLEKPKDAMDIYGRILDDINTRYLLGYYPTNKLRDGKRRTVMVEVKGHPEYSVSGRKSYIAPDDDVNNER